MNGTKSDDKHSCVYKQIFSMVGFLDYIVRAVPGEPNF